MSTGPHDILSYRYDNLGANIRAGCLTAYVPCLWMFCVMVLFLHTPDAGCRSNSRSGGTPYAYSAIWPRAIGCCVQSVYWRRRASYTAVAPLPCPYGVVPFKERDERDYAQHYRFDISCWHHTRLT